MPVKNPDRVFKRVSFATVKEANVFSCTHKHDQLVV